MTLSYYPKRSMFLYLFPSNISSEHLNQGDSHRSKSRPSVPSTQRDRLPEVQPPDGSLADIQSAFGRGHVSTTPAISSVLKHMPGRGAAIACPLVSVPQVGISTRGAQWREPAASKSPPPASCSTPPPPSRVVSSIAR